VSPLTHSVLFVTRLNRLPSRLSCLFSISQEWALWCIVSSRMQLSVVSDDKEPTHTKFLRSVVPDRFSSIEQFLLRADTVETHALDQHCRSQAGSHRKRRCPEDLLDRRG
jgi:hypothetical protein